MKKLYRNESNRPDWSFEVFPPRNRDGLESLYRVVEELLVYKPAFISVTYGAGGGTRELSQEIAREVHKRFRVPVTAHLTCVGATVDELRTWLTQAAEIGVSNIMALRGDPPKGESEFQAVDGGFRYAIDLVRMLRKEFPKFGIGVAGYPETHIDAESPQQDLVRLVEKVESGGDAVFTQLFYDNEDFIRFESDCRRLGVTTPIIPGLLPVLSLAQVKRITTLCKSRLPESLLAKLEACQDDADAQITVGVEHCRAQVQGLLKAGVKGIHFYVLNRADTMHRILKDIA